MCVLFFFVFHLLLKFWNFISASSDFTYILLYLKLDRCQGSWKLCEEIDGRLNCIKNVDAEVKKAHIISISVQYSTAVNCETEI